MKKVNDQAMNGLVIVAIIVCFFLAFFMMFECGNQNETSTIPTNGSPSFDDMILNGKTGDSLWSFYSGFEGNTIYHDLTLDPDLPNFVSGRWYEEQFSSGDIEIIQIQDGSDVCKLTAPKDTGDGAYVSICRGYSAKDGIIWEPELPQVAWDVYFYFPSEVWNKGDYVNMIINTEVFSPAMEKSYAGALILTHIKNTENAILSVWDKSESNIKTIADDIPLHADKWYYAQLVIDTDTKKYISCKIKGQGLSRIYEEIPYEIVTTDRTSQINIPLIAFYLNVNTNGEGVYIFFDDTLARFPKEN